MPQAHHIAIAFVPEWRKLVPITGWDHAWWYSGHLDAELMDRRRGRWWERGLRQFLPGKQRIVCGAPYRWIEEAGETHCS